MKSKSVKDKLWKCILDLKAIQMVCSIQKNTENPVVSLDKEVRENLEFAIKILEEKYGELK